MPYSSSETVEGRPNSKANDNDLTDRQLLLWGAAGGALSVAASFGLFDVQQIQHMVQGDKPVTQLVTAFVAMPLTVTAGAIWAKLQKPLRTQMQAVQLGIVAPAAISAMLASPIGGGIGDLVTAQLDIRLISPAYAQQAPTSPRPSTFECIVKAVVKRPC